MRPIHERSEFQPIVYSLVLHTALILFAMWVHVAQPFAAPEEDLLRFNVKSVDTRPLLLKHTSPATNPDSIVHSRRFLKGSGKAKSSAPKDVPVESLVKAETASKSDREDISKRLEIEESDTAKRPEIESLMTDVESGHSMDAVQVQPKKISSADDLKKMVERHKAGAQNLVQFLAKPLQNMGLGGQDSLDIDPEEGMPGFTPVEGTLGNSMFDQGGGTQESKGEILKYESVDDFLDIQTSTYQDPKDSQKYFMIKIFARKNAKALKVMPKEIIFAIDCSLSISRERLDEFKRGISHCLKNLNKGDVFNIVAFQDKAQLFRPSSIAPTPEIIKEAERFVSELTSNRATDVYNALEKIVKSPLGRKPSNIILISDGRPTNGIVDSRELISSVTRINNKARPIFAYSGGAKVNRYLLDFISYQNRAWSQFIKERGQIHKGLGDFYSKIKDPVFIDLRYRLNGLPEEEVYPRSLPDFYRNAEFTLYGKYENENEFSAQLLGDIDGETKELIFTRSLAAAEKGGPEIMKGYAFNKIYYLISRVTSKGQNAAALKEIQSLSQRYGVTTPYSPDLQTTD